MPAVTRYLRKHLARSAGRGSDVGHTEVDGRAVSGPHGFEFLLGSGRGGLDRGDLAQPALLLASASRSTRLAWISSSRGFWAGSPPKEWASDARIFVLARGSVVATTGSEGHFPQFEVGEELVPCGGGELTVFFAGSLGATTGDERPGGVRSHLRDKWQRIPWLCPPWNDRRLSRRYAGQPGADGAGDKEPPKIVGPPFQGLAAGGDLGGL